MIGSFLTRALVMVLGYAYPAYECFKTVEKNKPEIEQLRFWCQYWILVAVLTVSERVGDAFISWLPMYSEAKLAFFVYLWCPKTKGTTYVYDTFFRPYVAKHETEIDRNLLEMRTRAGDIAILYWQKAAGYGQTRFFEILQYVASQSQSQSQPQRPRPVQQQQARPPPPAGPARQPPPAGPSRQPPPAGPSRQPAVVQQVQQPPPSPSKGQPSEPAQEAGPAPAAPPVQAQTSAGSNPTGGETTHLAKSSEAEPKQAEVANGSANEESQETVMEEAIRVTRGRLRKTRAAAASTASSR